MTQPNTKAHTTKAGTEPRSAAIEVDAFTTSPMRAVGHGGERPTAILTAREGGGVCVCVCVGGGGGVFIHE